MKKCTLISYSFSKGGAAIAAANHRKIIQELDYSVTSVSQDVSGSVQFFKRVISYLISKLQCLLCLSKCSLNLFSYNPVLSSFRNRSDVYFIHWINNDTLSIFDFSKIPYGCILYLHDEWLFSGINHYNYSNSFKTGIFKSSFPLNFLNWRVKFNKLSSRTDLIYLAPSSWMLDRAKNSKILSDKNIFLLPNPVDVDFFKKQSASECDSVKRSLDFDDDDFILCFGAIKGSSNPHKGFNYLVDALELLVSQYPEIYKERFRLVTFGGDSVCHTLFKNIKMYEFGRLDKSDLPMVYSLSDCLVSPSLFESFGQVVAEAMSCQLPVVSFDQTGLDDLVLDGITGLRANYLDSADLATKIHQMLTMSEVKRRDMGARARNHIVKCCAPSVIADLYKDVLKYAHSNKG